MLRSTRFPNRKSIAWDIQKDKRHRGNERTHPAASLGQDLKHEIIDIAAHFAHVGRVNEKNVVSRIVEANVSGSTSCGVISQELNSLQIARLDQGQKRFRIWFDKSAGNTILNKAFGSVSSITQDE